MTFTGIDYELKKLDELLTIEERRGQVINGLAHITESTAHRKEIKELLQVLKDVVQSFEQRLDWLPSLPSLECVRWAQSVLAMKTMRFMVVSPTDGELRVTLGDRSGHVVFDQFVNSQHETWDKVHAAFCGCYCISFDYDQGVSRLQKVAKRNDLPLPVIIGESLQKHAAVYYNEPHLDLEEAAGFQGHPLPAGADAADHIAAMHAVVSGMAQGIVDISTSKQNKEDM